MGATSLRATVRPVVPTFVVDFAALTVAFARHQLGAMIEIHSDSAAPPARDIGQSLLRGFRQTCPACGKGKLFTSYLKVADACPACGEELHHHRADDAPPYFTMLIVGHVIVAGVLAVEMRYQPELWVHGVLWGPLLLAMSLLLLPRIKGALVGLQWALRMHGFGGEEDEAVIEPGAGSEPARKST